jgi:aquaporin Z
MTTQNRARAHWPEYLIEGWALGMFMISAGVFSMLFEYHGSWLNHLIANPLIYSRWGQRSGAHMNPAVTLTYWSLGRVAGRDAIAYITAQFVGGTLGVWLMMLLSGAAFTASPVSYVATVPGEMGTAIAFVAEVAISFAMMMTILIISNRPTLKAYTGYFAGALVALYITFEAPLSGMSMNPARSFASALPSGVWQSFWIYLTAPLCGMLSAASCYQHLSSDQISCAKLLHPHDVRCIHCGHEPVGEIIRGMRHVN